MALNLQNWQVISDDHRDDHPRNLNFSLEHSNYWSRRYICMATFSGGLAFGSQDSSKFLKDIFDGFSLSRHLNFTLLPQAAILTKHIFDILVIWKKVQRELL